MRIEPYKRVDAIEFGASRDLVVASLGKPMREGRTRKGMVELEYPSGFYRFNANSLLAEISVDTPVVELDTMSVPFKNLGAFLRNQDHETFEAMGFIVSPKYGIAFDPHDASWVTAFPQESLSLWRSFTTR